MYNYKAKVISVYDGDTITAVVDLGFNISTIQKLRIIDANIYFDTPEIRRSSKVNEAHKAHGFEATERAKELLPIGSVIIIKTTKTDSFGRYLAEIWLESGKSYSATMISEGFQKKDKYWLD